MVSGVKSLIKFFRFSARRKSNAFGNEMEVKLMNGKKSP